MTFKPTSYGDKTATIRVSSNAVNENLINVQVSGKKYSVITFVVEEDPGGAKIENVKLKIKQADEPEQEVSTGSGRFAFCRDTLIPISIKLEQAAILGPSLLEMYRLCERAVAG